MGPDHIQDFTTAQYAELLRLAKSSYRFLGYREPRAGARSVLWRHDCDCSLNRALRLAQLERAESVKATYFLNPHCEFYSLLERGQARIVEQIIGAGHDIGLHFDATFYDVHSQNQLDDLVAREAGWLSDWFGREPMAFSFHNPTAFLLSCERARYGGLINCYSRDFKTAIPYCSDSNGYWRRRRLRDVLTSAEDPCLQVLTHPDWWQESPLYPRGRIFRCVYGRAEATMRLYDGILQAWGRENRAGPAAKLRFLEDLDASQFQLCDYLWNRRHLESLFLELWRLHERQINQLCRILFCQEWKMPAAVVDAFFGNSSPAPDSWSLFEAVFEVPWATASGSPEDVHRGWATVRQQLIHGRGHVASGQLEDGCVHLCRVLEATAKWGIAQRAIGHDGITPVDKACFDGPMMTDSKSAEQLEESKNRSEQGTDQRWREFLSRLTQRAGETQGETLK